MRNLFRVAPGSGVPFVGRTVAPFGRCIPQNRACKEFFEIQVVCCACNVAARRGVVALVR
jgi:hypothetical protein